MSNNQDRRFFIPPWLDDLDLKPHPFRVLCHLLRRAGTNGACFTSGPSIAQACHMSKDTVWPAIETLETGGLIKRLPKRFGGSNTYQITPPISGKTGLIGDGAIGGNNGVIDSLQSAEKAGLQSAEKPGCQSAEKAGCKGILSKKSNIKKSLSSPESLEFAEWFKSTLPHTVNLKANWRESFAKSHDELVRIDGRVPEAIRAVCQWARNDSFWKSNFMSPAKLRDRNPGGIQYFDVFTEKMKPTNGTGKFAGSDFGQPKLDIP
jgi:hypothetical protein